MKKIRLILSFVLIFALSFNVYAATNDVTSVESGFSDVEFSDGFRGFCIDSSLSGAYTGDNFTPSDSTDIATNNSDGSDISQYLKILFTQHFNELFVSDGNGGYVIDSAIADSTLQTVIWHFSDGRYIWGTSKTLVNAVKAYDGPAIPDSGYTLQLDNGDVIVFHFTVMQPQKDGQQHFFAYKIEVNPTPTHQHDYSDKWVTDGDNHWHECDCGDKKDVDSHKGGTADCINPPKCDECEKTYGDVDPDNHTGETELIGYKGATTDEPGYTGDVHCKDCGELIEKGEEIPQLHKHDYSDKWVTDGDNHWHECDCGDKKDLDSHKGGTADCVNPPKCDECDKTYGDVDPDNHTGETELIGYKGATTEEPGYTGDVHCKDCGELIEKGEEIPQLHKHDYSDKWVTDGDNHWHECDCGDKKDLDSHKGGTADCVNPPKCDECAETYGDVDPDNHTGETELIGYKGATTEEPGYTGDVHCKDCGELLEEGEEIPQIIDDNNGNDDNINDDDITDDDITDDDITDDDITDDDITDDDITDDDITDDDITDDDITDDDKDTSDKDEEDKDSTTDKNDSDKNDSNSVPKTGDGFTLILWVAVMFISIGGLVCLTSYKKRKYSRS